MSENGLMDKNDNQDLDFWQIISRARKSDDHASPSVSPDDLGKVLSSLSNQQVQAFSNKFSEKLCELNDWKLWGAGYVIAGGMSDDSFHYFRSWIIGKGEECYRVASSDPDALGPFIDDPEVENEELEYVPLEILEARGIEDDPRDAIDLDPDAQPRGTPFDEDTVRNQFPKLSSSF